MTRVKFGLTLPNRGVITGATTMDEMLQLAEMADGQPTWDSVWVGDSILAKPRLDAIALLGALAVKTERVKLGPACFASMPLRNALLLAYQWASLDFMSGQGEAPRDPRAPIVPDHHDPLQAEVLHQGAHV
jgi:alkanesulfonate monooxygenase SsuD/methylene tetrahydromethanopterin reductase-like flavin-dependent oxidoreductase (luciferase family)